MREAAPSVSRASDEAVMQAYPAFGGLLRSALSFPELRAVHSDRCDWELLQGPARAPDMAAPRLVGAEQITKSLRVRLFAHERGWRLVYDDTGSFDFLDGGRRIVWYPAADAVVEAVRLDVLGRVLPLALQIGGAGALHGSAVELEAGAVAFVAPKRHGKSTLARALVAAGARLLSDDVVPIRLAPYPVTYPGVQRLRLWPDSAAWHGDGSRADGPESGGRTPVELSDLELADRATPLRAVYLLSPVPPDPANPTPARRVPLPHMDAALALVTQMKVANLLGAEQAGATLGFCAALAGEVPVYRLEIVRDFHHLEDAVARILEWHATSRATSRPAEAT